MGLMSIDAPPVPSPQRQRRGLAIGNQAPLVPHVSVEQQAAQNQAVTNCLNLKKNVSAQ